MTNNMTTCSTLKKDQVSSCHMMVMWLENTEVLLIYFIIYYYTHNYIYTGHHYYTIGQRARIGGQTHSWYVSAKNAETNVVTVVRVWLCIQFVTAEVFFMMYISLIKGRRFYKPFSLLSRLLNFSSILGKRERRCRRGIFPSKISSSTRAM